MKFIEWMPGNGSRYECYIGEVERGDGWPMILFCWTNRGSRGGKSMVMQPEGYLTASYFKEKMGIGNDEDAAALMALVAKETKRMCVLPRCYNKCGCYDSKYSDEGLVLCAE